jgi:ketosteroid isomerase-like protein
MPSKADLAKENVMLLRRTLPIALALCALTILAPGTRADATSEARKAIQTLYNKQNAAAAKKDVEGVLANRTPDFEAIAVNGQKLTMDQVRQNIEQLLAVAQSIKATTAIKSFRLKGNNATVTTREHAEFVTTNPQTSTPAKVVIDGTSQDTWIKSGKGWQIKRSKALTEKMTVNGKAVSRPKS